jgi:hypothetical protein
MEPEELAAARRHFRCTTTPVGVAGDVVVGRYRALPFYQEFVEDLGVQGSRPINSLAEHRLIASFDWYHLLEDLTPRTWFRLQDVPKAGGPYVVKGVTNSKKEQWNTHMLASTFADVLRIEGELSRDRGLADQPIIVREYVPLRTLEVGINDLPFANEWRCFAYKGTLLTTAFYWSGAEDSAKAEAVLTPAGRALAKEAARRLADQVPFTAIDVAETADGRWIVIEINDGQMAGLSDTDPDALYAALAEALSAEPPAPAPSP